jgi:hypothetical protein
MKLISEKYSVYLSLSYKSEHCQRVLMLKGNGWNAYKTINFQDDLK